MMKLTVAISGKTASDLELALKEVSRLVEQGNVAGRNSNDTGEFSFDVTGEDEEADTCDECGENIPRTGGSLANRHHKESCSLHDPDGE